MIFNYSNHFPNLTETAAQYNCNLHFSYKIFLNNDEEFRNLAEFQIQLLITYSGFIGYLYKISGA